ncbi:hypothetical protein [Staphylococcus aureus]|nr:hypothetical protein [Staphylococcus aureus]
MEEVERKRIRKGQREDCQNKSKVKRENIRRNRKKKRRKNKEKQK